MAKEEKNKISHRSKALAMVKSHFAEAGYTFQMDTSTWMNCIGQQSNALSLFVSSGGRDKAKPADYLSILACIGQSMGNFFLHMWLSSETNELATFG